MNLRSIISTIILFTKNYLFRRGYFSYYKRIVKANRDKSLNSPLPGERQWLEKWKKLDPGVSPNAYRIFSRYIGESLNILPLETSVTYIEPILNPEDMLGVYCDKNYYDLLFGKQNTMGCIFRRMNGVYYHDDYSPIQQFSDKILHEILSDYKRIILKPSIDTSSGKGVELFTKDENANWVNKNGNSLSIEYLDSHKLTDVIVQECWQQSTYISQFGNSSVNTLRIFAYRSVVSGQIHIPAAIIRIGKDGSVVDNAHAGGVFVGINREGKLQSIAHDTYGRTYQKFNGIDYKNNHFFIPNYNIVQNFVKKQSEKILQHHIMAWDIVLDRNDMPAICEVNVNGFGAWVYQFAIAPTFGEWTDEVIQYCKHKTQKKILLKLFKQSS